MTQHYKDNQNNIYGFKPKGIEVVPVTIEEAKAIIESHKPVPTSQEQYELDLANWKAERQTLVDNIKVTWQKDTETPVVFQGDELSQTRMSRAIVALPDDVITVNWTADDNSVHAVTRTILQQLLFDAGQQQTAIWNEGRPVLPVQEETV